MAMTQEQNKLAASVYAKDPKVGARKLMRLGRCTRYAADQFLKEARAGGLEKDPYGYRLVTDPNPMRFKTGPKKPEAAAGKPAGVSVKEFKGRFDFEASLRRTIKELCRDQFVPDAAIREHCDIPIPAFRSVAELPEFKACQIKDRGTVFWSIKENVDEVRQQARKWGISK